MRSSKREKDEISLHRRILELAQEKKFEFTHVPPADRPLELVQLIDEEADFFSHYNGQVIDQEIGSTMSFDYLEEGINVSIRHYYPHDPRAEVALNELGGETPEERLVPVSLMSKDLDLDSVIIGRFVAGISKYSARRGDSHDFSIQLLVMSVCGNGTFRENLTYRGREIDPSPSESSISTQDFRLVAAIFSILQQGYGNTGLEFLCHEVMRNRAALSELAGRDIAPSMAFDAYVKLFGSYMSDFLKSYRDQVVQAIKRLNRQSN